MIKLCYIKRNFAIHFIVSTRMQKAALSIIIPAYNESKTIAKILDRITETKLPRETAKEIIIIDDCSTDTTREVIDEYVRKSEFKHIRYMRNEKNSGKGFGIRRGIQEAKGDFVIIQGCRPRI